MQTSKIIIGLAILTLTTLHSFGQKQINKMVFFAPNQFAVSTDNKLLLDSLVTKIKDKEYQITLVGHADSIGSEKLNLKLSKKRTISVATYLNLKGCDKMKITNKYLGEANPVFSNSTKNERVKNRCVEIIVKYESNEVALSAAKTTDVQPTILKEEKFENDTIIYCQNGAQIIVNSKTFYPKKIKEINFEVSEVYTICDILKSNSTTQTIDGNCLSSAGMIYIKPTLNSVEIQPNKGQLVTLKIPINNGIPDPKMKVYFAVKDKSGLTVWKEKTSELSYEENGTKFYVFKVDTLMGINIDKRLEVTCQKDGPKIKVKKFKDISVCQTYPNEIYLSRGAKLKNRKFIIDKVINDKKPILTIIAYDNDGIPYIAKGPLLELKYKKRKNLYIVNSKYFKKVLIDHSRKMTPNDYLCNYLDI
jgi:hypothetical protein